jgi:hypothetical protein
MSYKEYNFNPTKLSPDENNSQIKQREVSVERKIRRRLANVITSSLFYDLCVSSHLRFLV